MYETGALIFYNSTGVCRVQAIGTMENARPADALYYTLEPLYDNGVIHVPVDSKVFMRPVIDKTQAEDLLRSASELPAPKACTGTSPQVLGEYYRGFFASHTCEDLLILLRHLQQRANRAKSAGKQPGRTDLFYFQRAKALLAQEFSVALGVDEEQAAEIVCGCIQ